jgi:hypothetical protein
VGRSHHRLIRSVVQSRSPESAQLGLTRVNPHCQVSPDLGTPDRQLPQPKPERFRHGATPRRCESRPQATVRATSAPRPTLGLQVVVDAGRQAVSVDHATGTDRGHHRGHRRDCPARIRSRPGAPLNPERFGERRSAGMTVRGAVSVAGRPRDCWDVGDPIIAGGGDHACRGWLHRARYRSAGRRGPRRAWRRGRVARTPLTRPHSFIHADRCVVSSSVTVAIWR